MNSKEQQKKIIQFRVGDLDINLLRKEAARHGYTLSSYVRQLIKIGWTVNSKRRLPR